MVVKRNILDAIEKATKVDLLNAICGNARCLCINCIDAAFQKEAKKSNNYEVALFRSLQKALLSSCRYPFCCGPNCYYPSIQVEEFHGNKKQVKFEAAEDYLRNSVRCELCDLLIAVFSKKEKIIRLTFLQVKSEREPSLRDGDHKFKGNLEQWYLLSKKPP